MDVGLVLPPTTPLAAIKLFVPSPLATKQVHDLSPLLRDPTTLRAVFNEVVEVDDAGEQGFRFSFKGCTFRLLRFDRAAISVSSVGDRGTILQIAGHAFEPVHNSRDRCYLRFRLSFVGKEASLLTSDRSSNQHGFSPSVESQELVEFRLNERRNYPQEIASEAHDARFCVKALHYFLIRDIGNALVTSNSVPKKIRRLEAISGAVTSTGQPDPARDCQRISWLGP